MRSHDFPGTFIVVEGADGAGTTTQSERLAEELDAHYTAEPTDSKVGRKVEEMITSEEYSAEAIALAFASDRLLHLEEEIVPRLKAGETVVCDRYYHSSLVYQPALGADYGWVKELNTDTLTPDLTVVLDISSREALSRIEKREHEVTEDTVSDYDEDQASLNYFTNNGDEPIFENLSFQERVVLGYRDLKDKLDEEMVIVDSDQPIDDVFTEVRTVVENRELG